MDELLKGIGAGCALIVGVLLFVLLTELEYVLPQTFREGTVEIDSETSYSCTLTERSKKLKKAKEAYEQLLKEKK